jgi:hypothetical protein
MEYVVQGGKWHRGVDLHLIECPLVTHYTSLYWQLSPLTIYDDYRGII